MMEPTSQYLLPYYFSYAQPTKKESSLTWDIVPKKIPGELFLSEGFQASNDRFRVYLIHVVWNNLLQRENCRPIRGVYYFRDRLDDF
jgi:hypothetical protein